MPNDYKTFFLHISAHENVKNPAVVFKIFATDFSFVSFIIYGKQSPGTFTKRNGDYSNFMKKLTLFTLFP